LRYYLTSIDKTVNSGRIRGFGPPEKSSRESRAPFPLFTNLLNATFQDDNAIDEPDREDGSDLASPDVKRQRLDSRSPSRTPSSRGSSPDLRRSRRKASRSNVSDSGSERGRFVSRSPSVSDDGEEGDTRPRYVSRSRSVSPDRVAAQIEDGERIDGDV
jgi:hypothetical protein